MNTNKTMKHVIVKYRYGDERTFYEKDGEWFVDLGERIFVRSGEEFVEPNGGPFISKGTKLSRYSSRLPDVEITTIDSVADTIYRLTTKEQQ